MIFQAPKYFSRSNFGSRNSQGKTQETLWTVRTLSLKATTMICQRSFFNDAHILALKRLHPFLKNARIYSFAVHAFVHFCNATVCIPYHFVIFIHGIPKLTSCETKTVLSNYFVSRKCTWNILTACVHMMLVMLIALRIFWWDEFLIFERAKN